MANLRSPKDEIARQIVFTALPHGEMISVPFFVGIERLFSIVASSVRGGFDSLGSSVALYPATGTGPPERSSATDRG